MFLILEVEQAYMSYNDIIKVDDIINAKKFETMDDTIGHVKKHYGHLLHNDKFEGKGGLALIILSSENLEIVKSIYHYGLFP